MSKVPTLKFLVVDDMSTMRKIVSAQLKAMGATQIVEADNGAKAWAILEAEAAQPTIQMVVSDWNMPELTGLDLLKKCRAHAAYQNLAFLLVTAEAEIHQVKEALAAKVDNYVVKPFTPQSFQEKLGAVVAKRFPG